MTTSTRALQPMSGSPAPALACAGPTCVRYEVENRIAVLTIDNPPVNASTAQVRSGLLAGVRTAASDPEVDALVLIGAGANFISGSDLREFAGPLPPPELPAVIEAIEFCPKPVVAALSGATLGGGFELALGCDARVALDGAVVGLPEITLGMIPGAGGTQRPLRILGGARTLDLVTSGKRIPAAAALAEGLLDKVVDASLRDEAVSYARGMGGKRVLRTLPVPEDECGALEQAALSVLSRRGARPPAVAAIGAVFAGLVLPAAEALAHERREFSRLRESAEAAALRHLFFARKAAEKKNRASVPVEIRSAGVVGAGTMGASIARAFVEAGIPTTVVDTDPAAAAAVTDRLSRSYAQMVAQGRLGQEEAAARTSRLKGSGSLSALAGADLVVEAVFEDAGVKKAVLEDLEGILGPGVPLATNTSYLDIDELAAGLADPTRVVGMHFFSPAHRTQVLEVVRAERTGQRALDTAFAAARPLGKLPIVARVCDGFIGNRIFNAYRRQCELMVEEGALPQQVDAALEGFGFAMGPFAVADMSGLDVAWRMRKARTAARRPGERYPDVADALCELGRFGQKSGRGWYRYQEGSRVPLPDPEVEALIKHSAAAKKTPQRTFSGQEIVERALAAMANEAALLLGEGIAERAGDVDLLLTLGYGFPAHEGGITSWASNMGPGRLAEALDALEEAAGPGFRRADPAILLA